MVSSHFVGGWALLATHFLTLCWLMICLVVESSQGGRLSGRWLTWFTHWSLVLLSLGGGLGLATQARHMWRCRGGRRASSGSGSGAAAAGRDAFAQVSPKPLLSGPRSDSPAFTATGAGAASRRNGSSGGGSGGGEAGTAGPSVSVDMDAALGVRRSAVGGAGDGGGGGGVGEVLSGTAACPTAAEPTAVAAAAVEVALHARAGQPDPEAGPGGVVAAVVADATGGDAAGQAGKWDALSISYLLTMETAVVAALYLDIYYWVVLVGVQGGRPSNPATYLKHAGNLGVAFLEVSLTRMPIVSVHFQAVLAYGTAYMLMVCIYGSTTGVWRYGLDWHRPFGVAVAPLVPLGLLASMLCWLGVALLRARAAAALHGWRDAAALRRRGRGRGAICSRSSGGRGPGAAGRGEGGAGAVELGGVSPGPASPWAPGDG